MQHECYQNEIRSPMFQTTNSNLHFFLGATSSTDVERTNRAMRRDEMIMCDAHEVPNKNHDLDVSESMHVFLACAGLSSDALLDDSRWWETFRRCLQECGYSPVAARFAGRMVKNTILSMPDNDVDNHDNTVTAIDRVLQTILSRNPDDTILEGHYCYENIFRIFQRSFSTMTTNLVAEELQLCLAAFAVAFQRDYAERPWVPASAVDMLFQNLVRTFEAFGIQIRSEESSYTDGNSFGQIGAEIVGSLVALNFLDAESFIFNGKDSTWYRLNHDLVHKYSICIGQSIFGSFCDRDFEKPIHSVLVDGYSKITNDLRSWEELPCIEYDHFILEELPYHMEKAGTEDLAFCTIQNNAFMRARIMWMGIVESTERLVQDLEMLDIAPDVVQTLIRRFVGVLLKESKAAAHLPIKLETARAVVKAGKFLTLKCLWLDAAGYFADALAIYERLGLQEIDTEVHMLRECMSSVVIPDVILVPRCDPYRLTLKHAEALQRVGDEVVPLELSSHPGLGIVVSSACRMVPKVGIGPSESAIRASFTKKGRLVNASGDGVLCIMRNRSRRRIPLQPGQDIMLAPYSTIIGNQCAPHIMMDDLLTEVTIDGHGCIIPTCAPNLAFGYGLPPLMLVPRDSPMRIVFQGVHEAANGNTLTQPTHRNPLPLGKLLSHPERALVDTQDECSSSFHRPFFVFGLGMAKDEYPLVFSGRIITQVDGTGIMVDDPFKLTSGSSMVFAHTAAPPNQSWIFRFTSTFRFIDLAGNEDGTISPFYAPHLALGVLKVGLANEITSERHMQAASMAAKESRYTLIICLRVAIAQALLICAYLLLFPSDLFSLQYTWVFKSVKNARISNEKKAQ